MTQIRFDDPQLEVSPCGFCGGTEEESILPVGQLRVVRCVSCNLIRTNPRFTREQLLTRICDAEGNPVDRFRRFYLSPRTATYRKWLAALQPVRETRRLLDIGCGLGLFLEEACRVGWDSVGIDPSPANVKHAAERGLKVLQGTAELAPALVDGRFDFVTFWDAFEHLADPLEVLAIVQGLLKPGGLVLMRLPDASVLNTPPSLSVWERSLYSFYTRHLFPWYPDRHLYHYSPEVLLNLMTEAGFVVQGTWRNEGMNEKVLDASSWWKRQVKYAILRWVVHRGWPHEFVHISARPHGGA